MRSTIPPSTLYTRTPAALAAGVLAFSAVMPPIALAEQDQTDDGTVAAAPAPSGEADQGTSFDPGGDAAALPDAPPPAPAAAAPAAQPAGDDADPVVDTGDGTDATAAGGSP